MSGALKPQPREVCHWTTVQVVPLPPGWVNIWNLDDGTQFTDACPAILLQEMRERSWCYDNLQPDGTWKVHAEEEVLKPPYETQAVFAINEEGWITNSDSFRQYGGTEYRPGGTQ